MLIEEVKAAETLGLIQGLADVVKNQQSTFQTQQATYLGLYGKRTSNLVLCPKLWNFCQNLCRNQHYLLALGFAYQMLLFPNLQENRI